MWRTRLNAVIAVACLTTLLGFLSVVWLKPRLGRDRIGSQSLITCAEAIKEFGEVESARIEHSFLVRNDCEEVLRIEKLGRSCSCTTVVIQQQKIAPGGTLELMVQVDVIPRNPGAITAFQETVLLHVRSVEAGATQVQSLTVQGTYVPPLYYLSRQVAMACPQARGKNFEGKFDLFVKKHRGVVIERVDTFGPLAFDARVVSKGMLVDGVHEHVEVQVYGTFMGGVLPQRGGLKIYSTAAALPELQIPVVLRVPPEARSTADPERVAFGVIKSGTTARDEVRISLPSGIDASSVRVLAGDPGLRLSTEPDTERRVIVICELDTSGKEGEFNSSFDVFLDPRSDAIGCHIPVSALIASDKTR